jgi:hypothetical protein
VPLLLPQNFQEFMTVTEIRERIEFHTAERDRHYARFIELTNEGIKDTSVLGPVAEHAAAIIELLVLIAKVG